MTRDENAGAHYEHDHEVEPIVVGLVAESDVVTLGLHAIFAGEPLIHLLELDLSAQPQRFVDIALFDAYSAGRFDASGVGRLCDDIAIGHLVVFSWDVGWRRVPQVWGSGADGFVYKGLDGEHLLAVLGRINDGERVLSGGLDATAQGPPSPEAPPRTEVQRGRLTAREVDVLKLIAQGLSNDEIAKRLYLSINSVKSYIRTAYRKLGLERRSQAVLWVMENGLYARPERVGSGHAA